MKKEKNLEIKFIAFILLMIPLFLFVICFIPLIKNQNPSIKLEGLFLILFTQSTYFYCIGLPVVSCVNRWLGDKK